MSEHKVALVIVAHPDDAEFGCAGTVALWVEQGWNVFYIICTDGASGGPDDAASVTAESRREIAATRQREQREAARIVGVKDVVFLPNPDGHLAPTSEFQRDLVRLIRQHRPQRVICMSPQRVWEPMLNFEKYHPDHLVAGQVALAALYPMAQNPSSFPELLDEGLKPHRVREVYVMLAPHPNHGVDVTSTHERKMQALRAHQSQLANAGEAEALVRQQDADWGKKWNAQYAEEFHRITG